jgi:hypothetical protein
MLNLINDLKKEAENTPPINYDHKGKTPLELLCTLLLYWGLIKTALKLARIFTWNGTRQRIDEIIKLFDEAADFWIKLK